MSSSGACRACWFCSGQHRALRCGFRNVALHAFILAALWKQLIIIIVLFYALLVFVYVLAGGFGHLFQAMVIALCVRCDG